MMDAGPPDNPLSGSIPAAYRHEIRLRTGRVAYVEALYQYLTYPDDASNLTPEGNQERIDVAYHLALNLFGRRRVITIEPGRGLAAEPDESAMLPYVTCLAKLTLNSLVMDPMPTLGPLSYVAVVWFQEDFGFPIDAAIMQELQKIDWEYADQGPLPGEPVQEEDEEPDIF